MGFTTGFTGGVTLTLSVAYLSVLAHQRNREQQGQILRHQALVLQGLVDPFPPLPPPSRSEVAAAQRANTVEVAKDRWNHEVENAVRWVQHTDWVQVRERLEDSASRLWGGSSAEASAEQAKRKIAPLLNEATASLDETSTSVAAAARGAFDKVKAEGKGIIAATREKAKEAVGKAVGIAEEATLPTLSPVERALQQRYERPEAKVNPTVADALKERCAGDGRTWVAQLHMERGDGATGLVLITSTCLCVHRQSRDTFKQVSQDVVLTFCQIPKPKIRTSQQALQQPSSAKMPSSDPAPRMTTQRNQQRLSDWYAYKQSKSQHAKKKYEAKTAERDAKWVEQDKRLMRSMQKQWKTEKAEREKKQLEQNKRRLEKLQKRREVIDVKLERAKLTSCVSKPKHSHKKKITSHTFARSPCSEAYTELFEQPSTMAPSEAPYESPSEAPPESPGLAPQETPVEARYENTGLLPYQTHGLAPYRTRGLAPYQATGLAPQETPVEAPHENPGLLPYQAPGVAPCQTHGVAPRETPGLAPQETPIEAPYENPGFVPCQTPGVAPFQTHGVAPYQTHDVAPNEAPIGPFEPNGGTLNPPPIVAPSKAPTVAPSKAPSVAPSKTPSIAPSKAPNAAPSRAPSKAHSKAASKAPSKAHSVAPSKAPSKTPSKAPSKAPSVALSKSASKSSSRHKSTSDDKVKSRKRNVRGAENHRRPVGYYELEEIRGIPKVSGYLDSLPDYAETIPDEHDLDYKQYSANLDHQHLLGVGAAKEEHLDEALLAQENEFVFETPSLCEHSREDVIYDW
ncbi:hypothetical protein G7046_g8218 [Stylonectria norvegica]|nr:hypothetical protein G7046_g8218 [Stylonectria norvegica]